MAGGGGGGGSEGGGGGSEGGRGHWIQRENIGRQSRKCHSSFMTTHPARPLMLNLLLNSYLLFSSPIIKRSGGGGGDL